MKCKHCGIENAYGSRFCKGCCAPLEYDSETEQRNNEKTIKNERKKKKNLKLKKIHKIGIKIISLCVVCGIVLFVFYDKDLKTFNTSNIQNVSTKILDLSKKKDIEADNMSIINENRTPLKIRETVESKSYIISYNSLKLIDSDSEDALVYSINGNKECILIELSIENKGYKEIPITSLFQFKGYLDGIEKASNLTVVSDGNSIPIETVLQSRQTHIGHLGYSLQEGWKELKIVVNIDGVEDEPYIHVENPKNRTISKDEINSIIVDCSIEDFMYENKLNISDEQLYIIIEDFMHSYKLSKGDFIPHEVLKNYIKNNI